MNALMLRTKKCYQEYPVKPHKTSLEAVSTPSQLITQNYCIPYIPELGERVGMHAAVLLQQIHYWTTKGFGEHKLGKTWIHNTYEAWAQQLKCSVSCIRQTVNKLKQEGLIETRAFRSRYGDTSKWYAVNYDALTNLGFKLNTKENAPDEAVSSTDHQELPLALNENQPLTNDNKKPSPSNQENGRKGRVSQCDTPLSKTTKVIYNLSPANAESVFKNVILIWNKTIQQGGRPAKLTESRLRRIKRRFMIEFQGSMEKWKNFCELIAKNDFLMGMGKAGWKITLDWALEPHNIKKILEGYYQHWIRKKEKEIVSPTGKSYKPQAEILAGIQEAEKNIEASCHPVFWKETCKKLLFYLGAEKFTSWIAHLELQSQKDAEVVLKAPTRFVRDWIERDFSEIILKACQGLNPQIRYLELNYE